MLDVRITGYVVPLSEQPQASLTPVISVVNVADEDATITGLIRIYRDSTGLMIYDSRLAVTELAHGTSANIAALTPFDPPAPADDDYFIKADLVATSHLPGPPLPVTLGAWHFDVKTPPMGDAPAGHHVTHEDGGSDEIDLTGLVGLGDHGALTGLADNDHPQYRLRHLVVVESDLFSPTPWTPRALNSGTGYFAVANALHPGIFGLKSSTSANSGYSLLVSTLTYAGSALLQILIAGSETSLCWHRPQTLANTTRHHGFLDTFSHTIPADGVWIWQDPTTGIISGRTRSNSVGSTTGTGHQLITNTWYCEKIIVNADASRVDFYCYAEDGSELWHDFLATNIPTAAGRELFHAVIATNSGTTAVYLDDVDFLRLTIPNRREDL